MPFEELTKQIGRGRVVLTPVGEKAAGQLRAILNDLLTEEQTLGMVVPEETAIGRALRSGLVHEYLPHMVVETARGASRSKGALAGALHGEKTRKIAGPLAQIEHEASKAILAGEDVLPPRYTHDPFQAVAIKGAKLYSQKQQIEQVRALLDEFGVKVPTEKPSASALARAEEALGNIESKVEETGIQPRNTEAVVARVEALRAQKVAYEAAISKVPDGYRPLKVTNDNRRVLEAIGGKNVAIPSDLADHIEKNYRIIIDPLGLEEAAKQRWAGWRSFMEWWRSTSLAFPATRVRDAISNEVQLLQMGVRPNLEMRKVANIAAWNLGDPGLLAGKSWGGKTLKEWVSLARAHEVIGQYEGAYDLSRQFAQGAFEMEPTAWRKFLAQLKETPLKSTLNPLSRESLASQGSKAAATFLDNRARLIAFMDLVGNKGAKPANAVKLIDQVFPTARKLTSFERESIAPMTAFYTWQRTNLPHQLRQLLQNPGQFAAINKLDKAIRDEQEGRLPWELLPTGIRESTPLSMGRTEDGLWKFWSLSAYMPQSEVTKWIADKPTIREMVLSTVPHVFRRALLEAAPPVRLAGELAFQHDLYRDLPYAELPDRVLFMGYRIPRPVAGILANIRLLSVMDRTAKGLFSKGAIHPEPGREPESLADIVSREGLGTPKTKIVNPQKARVAFVREIEREVQERRGAIRRQARYSGSEAERERLLGEIRKLFQRRRQVLESSR